MSVQCYGEDGRESIRAIRLPQNNHLFSVRTETNQNSICFGCFSVCFAKQKKFVRFVSVFRTGIETTETNRNFLNKPEKSPKLLSIRVFSKQLNFFGSNRNKPKLNLFRLFSGLFFRETNKNLGVVSAFWTGIEIIETNRIYGMRN
jgi:hypothetical protein